MSVMSFITDAGEKLLGVPPATVASAGGTAPNGAQLNTIAGAAIAKYVASQYLTAQSLNITYDGTSKTVTVKGIASDQATKEKIALCCGNVHSVEKVDNQLTVAQNGAASVSSTFYDVKVGDTLSKIAKAVYGDANAHTKIFEANKPMLSHPNTIYPGQQLRMPANS